MTEQTSPYSHSLIDAGIDWITCTQVRGLEGRLFRDACEKLLDEQRAAGVEIVPATLRDYVGWRGSHLFAGARPQDRVCVMSADVAARHWATVAQPARNVSRLDVQASVWTHGEQPSLARSGYAKLKRAPPTRGRPRSFTLIRTHPYGETLNVGKRQSDAYGRVYDYSTAHKIGTAATVWRYEVEFKRTQARRHTTMLLADDDPRTLSAELVHRWFSTRSVPPTYEMTSCRLPNESAIVGLDRDALTWFEQSISKTVRKMIKRHGLPRVIFALGLSDLVEPRKESDSTNASDTARALPHNADRGVARPSNPDGLSLHNQRKQRAVLIPDGTKRDDG